MFEWISVKDSLPDIKEDVLVYVEDFGISQAFRFDETSWWILFDEVDWSDNITHWMKLPDKPVEVCNESV